MFSSFMKLVLEMNREEISTVCQSNSQHEIKI